MDYVQDHLFPAFLLDALGKHGKVQIITGAGHHSEGGVSVVKRWVWSGADSLLNRAARGEVPGATFHEARMQDLAFAPGSLDVVVSLFAVDHVPRTQHAALFARIFSWLRPGTGVAPMRSIVLERTAAASIDRMSIDGGGGFDVADMFDGAGDDTFVAHPAWAQLSGAGYSHRVSGFGEVNAYGSDGNDEALFYDSTGDDMYVGGPTYGHLHGSGYDNSAEGFDTYQVYASTGDDRAVFYDSAGDETYVATPEYARFEGSSFYHQADGFNRVDAYATEGGNDWAYLYDSAGEDAFRG